MKEFVAEIILAMMFKATMSMATLPDKVSTRPGLHKVARVLPCGSCVLIKSEPTDVFQASACVLFADIPLIKESHMPGPTSKWEGTD